MIYLKGFTFNPFMENTYLLYDNNGDCFVIDPGCSNQEERNTLQQFIEENNLNIKRLLNTHCHIDHVLGNQFIKDTYKVPLEIPEKEKEILEAGPAYAEMFGIPFYSESAVPDNYIKAGETLTLGQTEIETRFVPGHSPGHIAFYIPDNNICIGGDVLFRGSVGRTDFPGCDFNTLMQSIQTQFFNLPDNTVVYPGHGPETTVGEEKEHNPFCGKKAQ